MPHKCKLKAQKFIANAQTHYLPLEKCICISASFIHPSVNFNVYYHCLRLIYLLSLLLAMKFHEKYPQLKEKNFLAQVLTNTVFSTMSLGNQHIALSRVEEIVLSMLKEKELKGGQFFTNQVP